MDMDNPIVPRDEILVRLCNGFYEVVPATYQTYCVLTASICQRVLRHFGVGANVVPCQLWWAGPDQNFVLGFCNDEPGELWDGHVVCMTQGWVIDAALRHIQESIGAVVPSILLSRAFGISSNVISRFNLNGQAWLWWHRPPSDRRIVIPREPEELIVRYADELISRIQSDLASGNVAATAVESCDGPAQGSGPYAP
jgi:hypothetical protein